MPVNTTFGDYEIDTDTSNGAKLEIVHKPTGRTWSLNEGRVNGLQYVNKPSDLPEPENGVRTLDATASAYLFTDFIMDEASLDLNGVPIMSYHGAAGGYICTGGGPAFQADGTKVMINDMYGHCPGGQLFDFSADSDTTMYVTDCSFADPAGFGGISDLGFVDGYRVQSFKSVNFENFDAGLTLKGTCDKSFFQSCPFRGITASGVEILNIASDFDANIFKVSSNCFIKDVQSDTKVLVKHPDSTITEYLKYNNVDHDDTVTKANILNGSVEKDDPGVVVRNSFPLADSTIRGELVLDGQITVAGSGAGPTEITSGIYDLFAAERVSNPSPGIFEYNAKYDTDFNLKVDIVVSGSNTTFQVTAARNDATVDRSMVEQSTSGSSKPAAARTELIVPDAAAGDQFSVFLENTGGTADLNVDQLSIKGGVA